MPSEGRTRHIDRGVIPFALLQLTAVGVVTASPQVAPWLPLATGILEENAVALVGHAFAAVAARRARP